MKRFITLLLLPFFLSACAVPSALTLAGYAVESASFMKTGKTVTDHAVSAVAGRDCQLLHGVTKGQVCESDGRSKKIDLKSMPIADTGKETTMRLEGAKTHRGGKKYIKKPTDRWVVVVGTFPDLYVSSTCDHKFIA